MSDVEFEEVNTYDSEPLKKRFDNDELIRKQKRGPLYTRIALIITVLCFSVSIVVLFRAFHVQQFDETSFKNQYVKPLP